MKRAEEIKNKFASPDLCVRRDFTAGGLNGCLLFAPDLSNDVAIANILFALERQQEKTENAVDLIRRVLYISSADTDTDLDVITGRILDGDCAIIMDGIEDIVLANTRSWEKRAISEPPAESVVRGPREGFTEDIKTSLTLLERRLRTPELAIERLKIGRSSHTSVAVVYLKNIASPKIVDEILKRLKKIDIDTVNDSYTLEPFLENRPLSLFKQIGFTERPDIAAAKLTEGRVAVIVDGSPIVLTLPFLLVEDFQSPEDYYQRFSFSTFLRFLRLAAIMMAILLPGIFVSLLQFHYDLVPLKFLVTIMNSIRDTPFPPLGEMLVVIFLFEIIREASLRMPRLVSMAMSIVGAIVLGETIVRAGIISPPTILIIAISSISMFAVPNHIGTSTLLRILFTLLGGLAGLYGMLLGGVFLIRYLADMDAYGSPYLAPLAPLVTGDHGDTLVKRPVTELKKRPKSVKNINPTRQA